MRKYANKNKNSRFQMIFQYYTSKNIDTIIINKDIKQKLYPLQPNSVFIFKLWKYYQENIKN